MLGGKGVPLGELKYTILKGCVSNYNFIGDRKICFATCSRINLLASIIATELAKTGNRYHINCTLTILNDWKSTPYQSNVNRSDALTYKTPSDFICLLAFSWKIYRILSRWNILGYEMVERTFEPI